MAPRTRKGGAERGRREALEALWLAISEQNLEGMQSVLRERCDDLRDGALDTRNEITERHDPALVMCCRSGFLAGVEPLLDAGANIVSTNVPGATALYIAAQEGHAPVIALLLEHNAQIDLVDANGVNALHIAAYDDRPEVCALLIAKGLDPATEDNFGFSALSHYGVCLDNNNPDDWDEVLNGPFRPPLTDEEKEERVTQLKAARDAYLLQKLRDDNWYRRAAFMHTLVGSGIRLTAAQTAEHALIQAASDKSAKIPPIPRKTKAQNIAYLNKQIFGTEGYVRKVTEYI